MITIPLVTSDSKIWNKEDFILSICDAMSKHQPITIDLLNEGPDLESLGITTLLEKLIAQFKYTLDINILTKNILQLEIDHCSIIKSPPMHFIDNTVNRLSTADTTKQINKHFGLFIGRSNLLRLYLSSYLYQYYQKQTCQTFHYTPKDNFHKDNLGLMELINYTGVEYIHQVATLLKDSPLTLQAAVPQYPILMDHHCDISIYYHNFFVELICETYYSGTTFFPTEKTWRPIIMRTPFIIQGPQYFLHRLRDLGFRTFSNWWDEGYAEDPADWQPYEIIRILDYLAVKTTTELETMHQEMQSILEHNYNTLISLSAADFNKISNVQ